MTSHEFSELQSRLDAELDLLHLARAGQPGSAALASTRRLVANEVRRLRRHSSGAAVAVRMGSGLAAALGLFWLTTGPAVLKSTRSDAFAATHSSLDDWVAAMDASSEQLASQIAGYDSSDADAELDQWIDLEQLSEDTGA